MSHRQRNFWEPTYEPAAEPLSAEVEWSRLAESKGPVGKLCTGETFLAASLSRVENKIFERCDFLGDWTQHPGITFSQCQFVKCYFGRSNWDKAKFSRCTFTECSFAVSRFINCQFMSCVYREISFSGNETQFENSLVDASRFIAAAYTNLDPHVLSEKSTSAKYQRYRLSVTKSKAARGLLNSVRTQSDDNLFYVAVRTFAVQRAKTDIQEAAYFIQTDRWYLRVWFLAVLVARLVELMIVAFYGGMTKWGKSIIRPVTMGLACIACFGLLYHHFAQIAFVPAFVRACEILLLAGYTKYSVLTAETGALQWLHLLNLLAGVVWYSVIFPVILGKCLYQRG